MDHKRDKESWRGLSNEIAWLAVLFAVVGAVIASRYLTGLTGIQWWQYLYIFGAAAGVFFIGHFLLLMLLVLPVTRLSPKIGRAIAFGLTWILLVALGTDTFVYQQYRFHINWAMIDLALVGGREVFTFSAAMMTRIVLLICLLGILTVILVWGATKIKVKALWPSFVILTSYLCVNLVNAYSVAQNLKSITVLSERVPLYYPIRANTLLSKFDLVLQEERINRSNAFTAFRYPLNNVLYGKGEDLNVVIIAVDSLRSDVVTPQIMPNLAKIAKDGIYFQDHYSAGNATRSGIFGLFFGLPPFYWQAALSSSTSPALMSGFIDAGYDIGVFSTATLKRPEFYSTVFSRVRPLRMGSKGSGGVIDRDVESVEDFENWLSDRRDESQKFMSFVFLDSVHAVVVPESENLPYKNYWEDLNHLELGPDFDPVPYFNRYKNSAYGADILIGKIVDILRDKSLLENTVVIVTSDHGDEFNDSGLNYWGHNGNFSQAQIKIPLVMYWPGMDSQVVKHRTTAYDVSATLLKRVLAAQNPLEDFGVGQDLFDPKAREIFFVGSYSEDAIVAGDEVLLIKMSGALEGHSLKDWKEIDAAPLKKWVPAYLQMRGKYRH